MAPACQVARRRVHNYIIPLIKPEASYNRLVRWFPPDGQTIFLETATQVRFSMGGGPKDSSEGRVLELKRQTGARIFLRNVARERCQLGTPARSLSR